MARRAGGTVIEGEKELLKKFDALEAVGKRVVMKKALLVGAIPIMNEWKQTAPFKTGQYKRSIHSRVTRDSDKLVEVQIGTDITNPPYPAYLEFGYETKKGKVVAPKPFARKAFQKMKVKATKEASEIFVQEIMKAAQA